MMMGKGHGMFKEKEENNTRKRKQSKVNVNLRLKIMNFQSTQSMHLCDFMQQHWTAQMEFQGIPGKTEGGFFQG